MIIDKITVGFVVQRYDTEEDKFVSQEFIAGDEVSYEDELGVAVEVDDFPYLSFDMVQPEGDNARGVDIRPVG